MSLVFFFELQSEHGVLIQRLIVGEQKPRRAQLKRPKGRLDFSHTCY